MSRVSPYLVMALGVCLLGLIGLSQAIQIRSPGFGYDRTGPGFFPIVASGLLVISGAALAIRAWSGERPTVDADEAETQRDFALTDFALLAGSLAISVLLFRTAGFVVSASVLFFGTTLSFGSRQHVVNGAAAIGFSLALYLLFTNLLNVALPPGIIPL